LVRELDFGSAPDSTRAALTFGDSPVLVAPIGPAQNESLITWSVDEAPAQWLPRLDVIAMDYLAPDQSASAQVARRWLHLAPRYMGRLARNVRVLRCSTPAANRIAQRMRAGVASGEIPIVVRIDFI
jgi:hypothetical protein